MAYFPSRGLLSAGVLSLLLSLSAWLRPATPYSAPSHPASGPVAATVTMTNTLKFTPDTVRIQVGEAVQWKNTSLLAHTVTAKPEEATMAGSVKLPEGAEPFGSGMMDPKATYTHTFTVPGTYRYFCIPHEAAKMRGTVIVEEQ